MPRSIPASRIADLERALDDLLPPRQFEGAAPPELIARAREWSDAVWQEAAASGPVSLSEDTRNRGLLLAQRPIFVCGVHRSGTTLVRDLLDHHPALAVLPSEGTFFTNFRAQLAVQTNSQRFFITEWIRRLANPINQPPYWTIGRSTVSASPYVGFARASMAWWNTLQQERGATISSFPLAAVALAYAQTMGNGALSPNLVAWVEKTPTNEQHADRLRREYPEARIIHVVRDPLEVLASRKRVEERATGAFTNIRAVLHDLERSYVIAHTRAAGEGAARYMIVRYEDVIAAREATLINVAAFLSIEPTPTLFEPTVGGRPASRNSSFTNLTDRPDALSSAERESAGAVVAEAAARFGYHVPSPASWRARYLRLKLRWNTGARVSV